MNVENYLTHFKSYTFATDTIERALCNDFPCLKLKEEALLLRLIVVSSLVSEVEQPSAKARINLFVIHNAKRFYLLISIFCFFGFKM